jgi:hypothetical protein
VVTPAAFHRTLSDATPPRAVSAPLAALWWAKNGDWVKAHSLVMEEANAEAAWVHAYLHRVEGDLGNAQYWYGRARRPVPRGDFDAEWAAIAAALLGQGATSGR